MGLFGLLIIPILMAVIGFFLSKGRITGKEFAVHFGVVIVVMVLGYFLGRLSATADTEIWNGRIARKYMDTEHCCHSYPCNCRTICSGSGDNRSCSEHCDTCYLHSYDKYWQAVSTNNETVFHDGCNSPSSSPPQRWRDIREGEPTAVEHSYTNYIKGAPDSILRRQGLTEKYKSLIPEYPEVYDYYRATRFIVLGTNTMSNNDKMQWNEALSEINADLGAKKWVHIIVILVPTADRGYLYALEEAWLGGKKNDFVVVIGAPEYPKISWVGAMSWTRAENLKIIVRDRIENLGTFDGNAILGVIRDEVDAKFVFRPMDEFKYLAASVTPSRGVMIFLFILGIVISGGLQWYFWIEDPFDYRPYRGLRF